MHEAQKVSEHASCCRPAPLYKVVPTPFLWEFTMLRNTIKYVQINEGLRGDNSPRFQPWPPPQCSHWSVTNSQSPFRYDIFLSLCGWTLNKEMAWGVWYSNALCPFFSFEVSKCCLGFFFPISVDFLLGGSAKLPYSAVKFNEGVQDRDVATTQTLCRCVLQIKLE